VLANDVHYPLDYGTVMPMVCYLDRAQRTPIVPVSVCLSADLDEACEWGRHVAQVARESAKRVGFVASGSVSHKLVRGPERWPAPEDRALDDRMLSLLASGDLAGLESSLGDLARAAHVEAGGRHLALLVGALGAGYRGQVLGYGPSSGSGNAVVTLSPN